MSGFLLWVLAIALALVFVTMGAIKLLLPKERLIGQEWIADAPWPVIKLVGLVELVGGLGLVLPPLLDRPGLVPPAAFLLVLATFGVAVMHVRYREWKWLGPTVVFGLLAALLGWARL